MRHPVARLAWLAIAITLAFGRTTAARDSRLADAAERSDKTAIAALLKRGGDVNVPQPDGATALHWAAHRNDLDIAASLLRAGANPNAVNDYGVTPLFLAATNGSGPMAAVLLKAGANANAALSTGQTVLMTAARTGNVAAVEALLGAGANIEAKHEAREQTALMWAIAERHPDVARLLIDRGANITVPSKSGFTPLLFAAREGDIETTRLLLAKGVDVNDSSPEGVTPLLAATARGHVSLALFFLDRGARPDGNLAAVGYTPLHWAATTFEINPITYPGVTAPGEWEAMGGIPDRDAKLTLIRALIARGADVNARTRKRLLFQAPLIATTTSTPGVGATPFLAAAGSADVEVMRLLVAHGADPSIPSAGKETALMMATTADIEISVRLTEAKRLEAIRLAWELGNDLEAADTRGYRAIHMAARGGFHDIIAFLVDRGAELNPKSLRRGESRVPGVVSAWLEPQTPLGLVEGTLSGTLFYERPATAEFLRTLGAKSEGRYNKAALAESESVSAK